MKPSKRLCPEKYLSKLRLLCIREKSSTGPRFGKTSKNRKVCSKVSRGIERFEFEDAD